MPAVMTPNRVIPMWVNSIIWAPPFVLLVVFGYLRTSNYVVWQRPVKVISEVALISHGPGTNQ